MNLTFAVILLGSIVVAWFSIERNSSAISPTAHYTGYVWYRHGLSDDKLWTPSGFLLFHLLQPLMAFSKLVGGATVEDFLLARHNLIDFQLEELIQTGKADIIVEVASGLSARGLRFVRRHGNKIKYIEADLKHNSDLKQQLLLDHLSNNMNHQVITLDALKKTGPNSIREYLATVNQGSSVVIITEGLINYFNESTVIDMWRIFSENLSPFRYGTYISDIHLNAYDCKVGTSSRIFQLLLSIFVRGRVFLHFNDRLTAEWSLVNSGFLRAMVHRTQDWKDEVPSCSSRGASYVHIITAYTNEP